MTTFSAAPVEPRSRFWIVRPIISGLLMVAGLVLLRIGLSPFFGEYATDDVSVRIIALPFGCLGLVLLGVALLVAGPLNRWIDRLGWLVLGAGLMSFAILYGAARFG